MYEYFSKFFVKITGYFIIFLSITLLLSTIISFSVGIFTYKNFILADLPIINNLQKHYYFGGFRNIWQYNSECATIDDTLIYKPKIGTCKFDNIEFKTKLTFDKYGRVNGNDKLNQNTNKIAIIGDSHTMGWGVNDNETFSSLLEKKINNKVYNLGVSSYATQREIERLITHPDFDNIKTIIIQYCDNDLNENKNYPINNKETLTKYINSMQKYNNNKKYVLAKKLFSSFPILFKNFILNNDVSSDVKFFDNDHKFYLLKILNKYKANLLNRKIYIFYLNGSGFQGQDFKNWTLNSLKSDLDINFISLNISSSDFYKIDDHLNKYGHMNVSNQLYYYLNSKS